MQRRISTIVMLLTISLCGVAGAEDFDSEKNVKQTESAEKPQLFVTGEAEVHMNFSSPSNTYHVGQEDSKQDIKRHSKDSSNSRLCAGEANIDFEAKGKLENGLRYGATISFDTMKDDTGVDKMYITLARDGFGTIHLGNVKGPDAKAIVSGQQLIGGTTGADGTLPHDIEYATGIITPLNMIGYTNKATKIAYYSPRIVGFQFSTAFTPDTKHHGHTDKNWRTGDSSNGNDPGLMLRSSGDDERPSGRDNLVFALTHFHDFDNGFSTKISGVCLFENTQSVNVSSFDSNQGDYFSERVKLKNAKSYHLSATIGYKKFALGCGFIDNGKSRTPKNVNLNPMLGNFLCDPACTNAGKAWNVGMKYSLNEKWDLAGVFHNTQRKVAKHEKTKGKILTLTVDYKVCDGLKLFVEYDRALTRSTETACQKYNLIFKDKSNAALRKQHASLIAVGAKVCF